MDKKKRKRRKNDKLRKRNLKKWRKTYSLQITFLDMCVGIILPRDQPEIEKKFVDVLKKYTEVRTSDQASKSLTPEEQARLSKRIAAFLLKSTFLIALFIFLPYTRHLEHFNVPVL